MIQNIEKERNSFWLTSKTKKGSLDVRIYESKTGVVVNIYRSPTEEDGFLDPIASINADR